MLQSNNLIGGGKHSGLVLPPWVSADNAQATVFKNRTYTITWNATRGYYHDNTATYASTTKNADGNIPFGEFARTISATFWAYYMVPSGCVGRNFLEIVMDDASTKRIGSQDAHTANASGQTLYRGDVADYSGQANAVGQTYTYTIPEGKRVVRVEFMSAYLSGYPAPDRGVKSITATYY